MSQNVNVNLVPGNYPKEFHVSQYDVGRQLVANIVDSTGAYSIPSGATVTLVGTKPSGFGFTLTGSVGSGGVVTFSTTATVTAEYGRIPCELRITSGDTVLGTANLMLIVEESPHQEGVIDGNSETVIPELTILVERVEAAASNVLDMQVEADTLPAGSSATYSYDEETNTATFGIPQGEAGAGAAGVVAPAYSASSTYAVGDYVIHDGNLYRCTTAITTAEAFTAAHWTQVVLGDDVSNLKSEISELYEHDSLNLANPLAFTRNAWMANNGTITYNNATYFITGHIPVTAGKKYFTGGSVNGAARFVTLFNGDTVVSGSLQNIREFTIPDGVDNIVITGFMTDIDAFMVNEGLYLLPYRPYFVPRVDDAEDEIEHLTAENKVNYDAYSYLSSFAFAAGSLAGPAYIRFSANRCPINGRLKSITLLCPPTESGTVTVYLAKASNSTAKIYAHFNLTLHSLPFENTVYYNGIDFQYDGIVENGTIFGAQTSGGARLFYGTDGTGSFTCTDNLWVDSETFKITAPNSYNIGLGYEVIATDDDYKNIYKVKNKAIQLTDYKYYLDGDVINVMFTLNALTGKLNLYRDNQNATKGSRVDFVDFANGKIGFYKPSGNATTETLEVLQEKTLDFSLVVGHQYVAESIREHGTIHTIKLTDACTMQSDSLTISNTDSVGLSWGVRGYQEVSCDIDVMRSKAFSTQPYGAKVLVIGDSYIEGASIGGYKDKRWCALLRDALDGDIFINGLSGAPSAWLVDWLNSYLKDLVNPDYVIVQVGVNDGNLATYQTNMGKIIDLIKNYYHAIPVLVTIPPTVGTASASIWSSINAYVKASGELYIDEALVLSNGYDGISRDPSKFLSDNTHPNVVGHQAIFDRLKCDVPEIFIQ